MRKVRHVFLIFIQGSFSNNDGDEYENVSKNCVRATSTLIALIPSRSIRHVMANFSGVELQRTVHVSTFRKRKKRVVVVCSRSPQKIRQCLVVVVQWGQRNVQKNVMHVQSCCFANLNLLLFCRSRCINVAPYKWHYCFF